MSPKLIEQLKLINLLAGIIAADFISLSPSVCLCRWRIIDCISAVGCLAISLNTRDFVRGREWQQNVMHERSGKQCCHIFVDGPF